MRQSVKYEKNVPVVNVIFSEQDVVIKIARKIQNEKNLEKLKESKKEAIEIIRNNLKDQSLTL